MESKTCLMCNIENYIKSFYKRSSEGKDCKRTRGLKLYYEIKDKESNQPQIYYEKNRDKILLQKQNKKCIQIETLVRSHVESGNRLKSLEEKADLESNPNFGKLHRYIITNKWHSLTIYIVKFATQSLPKNNGITLFSLVGIYIEKSMDIRQPNFRKKN